MPRKTLYWILQLSGWVLYTFFSLGMIMVFAGVDNINSTMITLQVLVGVCMMGFSHFFRLYVKRFGWAKNKLKLLIPKIILGVLLLALACQSTIHLLIYFVLPQEGITPFNWVNFIGYSGSSYTVLLLWAAIYFGYQFVQRNRQNNLEKLELKAALQEAELAILKNQVNPHFLFNALNNIRSLIIVDPEKARKMVTHISELLSYSIQFNAAEKASLGQELEIVKDYLQLESVQFNDRLTYDLSIAEEALAVKIPPMAIQLLVENAIKHGISQLSAGGNINIQASLQQDHLSIKVTNTGQLYENGKREGIGLKNLIERLQILFGQFADLSLENSSDRTVTASLKIPLT